MKAGICYFVFVFIKFQFCVDWNLSVDHTVKATNIEKALLRLFQLFVWAFYLITPVGSIVATLLEMDPLLPIIGFIFRTIPIFEKLLRFIALNSEEFFNFCVFSFRVGWVTIFLYEGFRVLMFCLGLCIYVGKAVISYLTSISSLTTKFQSNIILRGFRLHLRIYKVLLIIFQSLEAPIKPTTSLGIVASTMAVAGCSFVVIRLHEVNEVYFTVFCGLVSFSAVILTEITLDTLGELNMKAVKLLLHFRKTEILLGMGALRKKLYLKELHFLPSQFLWAWVRRGFQEWRKRLRQKY